MYPLGFSFSRRTGLISLNLRTSNRQQRTVLPTDFYKIVPTANNGLSGGTVNVTAAQLLELEFTLSVEMNRDFFRTTDPILMPELIRYELDSRTGNFLLSLIGTAQNLVMLPNAFRKLTGVSHRSDLGTLTLNNAEIMKLGFIVAEGASNHVANRERYVYA